MCFFADEARKKHDIVDKMFGLRDWLISRKGQVRDEFPETRAEVEAEATAAQHLLHKMQGVPLVDCYMMWRAQEMMVAAVKRHAMREADGIYKWAPDATSQATVLSQSEAQTNTTSKVRLMFNSSVHMQCAARHWVQAPPLSTPTP